VQDGFWLDEDKDRIVQGAAQLGLALWKASP
jgi:hypothetical protein